MYWTRPYGPRIDRGETSVEIQCFGADQRDSLKWLDTACNGQISAFRRSWDIRLTLKMGTGPNVDYHFLSVEVNKKAIGRSRGNHETRYGEVWEGKAY